MYSVDNERIGEYLKKLIDKRYPSHRKFGKQCLIMTGVEPTEEELRKMSNRISQIIKGTKKGIQLTDLPIFTELLGVSCEELLSAGKVRTRSSSHVTNYDVAYSKDPKVWKEYVEREDKLILNCDEYGKTIIDYIFEFKNYKFLKYLLQEGIIWLVDNCGWDGMTYGAGTEIKRREIGYIDTSMPLQIQYEDYIRTQALALAIENKDIGMLDKLCAREIPALHEINARLQNSDLSKYYNKDLVNAIAHADKEALDYFIQEFVVEDQWKHPNRFIYPYIGNVIDIMLKEGRKEAEVVIKAINEHNRWVYKKLTEMIDDANTISCDRLAGLAMEDAIRGSIRKHIIDDVSLSENKDMITFYYIKGDKKADFFTSNIVAVSEQSGSASINNLVKESKVWYQKILDLKGEEL